MKIKLTTETSSLRSLITSPSHMFGRAAERARLLELLQSVHVNGGALILRGDPGVGKSALVDWTVARAEDEQMRVVRASGVESEAQLAFAGLHQLLMPVLAGEHELPPRQQQALHHALEPGADSPDLFIVSLAVLTLLSQYAVEAPLLMVADDAHWLDAQTLSVLAFVARRLHSQRIVLLVTGRHEPLGALAYARLPELTLEPLNDAAATALLDRQCPDLLQAVRSALLTIAAGNPLALVQLPADWAAAPDTVVAADLRLSERFVRGYAAQFPDLPRRTRTILIVAALNDGGALTEILGAASSLLASAALAQDLEPASDAGLILLGSRELRFRHPLTRLAIAQHAGFEERYAAHGALAAALEADPDRALWHRAAGAQGPDEAVASDLVTAAVRLRRRWGEPAALEALRQAAELTPDSARRGNRLLHAARSAFESGRPDLVDGLVEAAERVRLSAPDRWRARRFHEFMTERFDRTSLEEDVATALALHGEGETGPALDTLMAAAHQSWWRNVSGARRLPIVETLDMIDVPEHDARRYLILALCDPVGSGRSVINGLSGIGIQHFDDPDDLRLCGTALAALPELDLAERYLAAAVDGLRAERRLALLARALTSWASTCLWRAQFDVTRCAGEEAARLALETRQPRWAASAQLAVARAAALAGDDAAAEALAAEAARHLRGVIATPILVDLETTRGTIALSAGRYSDALRHLRRAFDPGDDLFHPLAGARSLIELVDAANLSAQPVQGATVIAMLEEPAHAMGSSTLLAALAYGRAVLAPEDEAETRYRAALADALDAPTCFKARLNLAYGLWLRRQRRVCDARAPLRTAVAAFEAINARPGAQKARQELLATGEGTPRPGPAAKELLTPQEQQTVELASRGLTNREIAERLLLSHRTVGSHLYRAFPKLGITSRSELVEALVARSATI